MCTAGYSGISRFKKQSLETGPKAKKEKKKETVCKVGPLSLHLTHIHALIFIMKYNHDHHK